MAHIFLVEDSEESSLLVKTCLEPLHTVEVARSMSEAKLLSQSSTFDLILLDINLPDGSGLELLEDLRKTLENKPPIILLSSKDTLADIVLGLNSGADDYVTKPFRNAELKARVEACLRRVLVANHSTKQSETLHVGDLFIDQDFQRVYRLKGEQRIDLNLTPLEFRILHYFVSHPNAPLTRFRIANHIWKDRPHFESKGIDSHISHLRKKLGPQGKLIKTVVGLGYAFQMKDSRDTHS